MSRDVQLMSPEQEAARERWYARPELFGVVGSLALAVGVGEIATNHTEAGLWSVIVGTVMLGHARELDSHKNTN